MLKFDVTSVPEAWGAGVLNSEFREVSEFFPSIGISISNGTKERTFFVLSNKDKSIVYTTFDRLTVTHYNVPIRFVSCPNSNNRYRSSFCKL